MASTCAGVPFFIVERSGSTKASVLPDPVSDQMSAERPWLTGANAARCTASGAERLAASSRALSTGPTGQPPHMTGLSSGTVDVMVGTAAACAGGAPASASRRSAASSSAAPLSPRKATVGSMLTSAYSASPPLSASACASAARSWWRSARRRAASRTSQYFVVRGE